MSADRFVSPCPPPTAREREIAEILIEECAEIARECADITQRATKLLRFGVQEVQPGQPLTNAQRLAHEIGDLMEVVELAVVSGLVSRAEIDAGMAAKKRQLAKFMQTRPEGVEGGR